MLTRCQPKEEPAPREYSRVRLLSVVESAETLTLEGEIYYCHPSGTSDHGFELSYMVDSAPPSKRVFKESSGSKSGTGKFSVNLPKTVYSNKAYTIRAYAVTGTYTVYSMDYNYSRNIFR